MVFKPEPVFKAVESILGKKEKANKPKSKTERIILFSPKGKTLNQKSVKKYLNYERLILLSPRYEGVDERIRKNLVDEEISIGDYILSGAELPAMVFIDSLARLIPGVVSDKDSIKRESFENSLLDFPHYTKPSEFRGMQVPSVLLSGDHKKIQQWRQKKAEELTRKLRPDLLR